MKNLVILTALLVSISAHAEKRYVIQESEAVVLLNTLQEGLAHAKAEVAPTAVFVKSLKCVSSDDSSRCTLINHNNSRITLSANDSSVLFEVLAGLKTRVLIGPRVDKREPLLDRTDISAGSESISALLLTCQSERDGMTVCEIAQE